MSLLSLFLQFQIFHELSQKLFSLARRQGFKTRGRGVVFDETLKRRLQFGSRLVGYAAAWRWHSGNDLMRCKPICRRFEPRPTRDFGRKINFAPLRMPRNVVELINLAKEFLYEFR